MQERRLGCWESGFRSAHDMLNGTMLVVGYSDVEAEFSESEFKEALKIIFAAHPLLSATIQIRGFNAYFVLNAEFSSIPVHIGYEKDWEMVFNQEIHTPVIPNEYLWRVNVIVYETGFKLLLTTHHALMDALSQISFIEQFLTLYNQKLMSQPAVSNNFDFLINVEAYLPLAPDWIEYYVQYDALHDTVISQIPYETFASIESRQSINYFYKLEQQSLEKIKHYCKKHAVTVNAWLNAAILKTQSQLNEDYPDVCLKTPVNLRDYCQPQISKNHLGCQLSIVDTFHKLDKDNIPTLAMNYQQQLKTNLPLMGFLPKEIDYNQVDIRFVSELFAVGNARRRKYLPNTFGVSNIGQLNIRCEFEKVKLKRYIFSTNHLVGNYYMFLSVSTLNEVMDFCFTYVAPLLSKSKAQRFIEKFFENLISP